MTGTRGKGQTEGDVKIWRIAVGVLITLTAAAAGGCVMLRPDIPFAALEAKYANGQSRFMDLPGGVRLHYRDQGNPNGPSIVMVHGFAASLDAWEPWVARLGNDYRIVTLDLPGHGLTRAPSTYVISLDRCADLVDVVADRLKLGRYVVVGNSMGGGVAWGLALRHPDHVRGLVLVDSVGLPEARRDRGSPLVFKIMASPAGRLLLRHMDTRPLAERGLRSAYVDPSLVTPALIDRYVDLSRAPGHRSILLNGQGPGSGPKITAETFKHIRIPTLVMHGEADTVIPVAAGRRLADAIPGARLITYPGVGHVPMEQIPDQSARDLRSFLQRLDAGTS
jgi:pimeloyl-ACP methyl ester carboxylesterase